MITRGSEEGGETANSSPLPTQMCEMRLSPDRYRRSVVGRITARITKCMDTVSRFIGAFLPWASPAKALGALPPRYPFWALQWPTQARIENAE